MTGVFTARPKEVCLVGSAGTTSLGLIPTNRITFLLEIGAFLGFVGALALAGGSLRSLKLVFPVAFATSLGGS